MPIDMQRHTSYFLYRKEKQMNNKNQMTIRFDGRDNDLLVKVKLLANKENRSFAGMVKNIIRRFFEKHMERVK
jgi:hypothetical protein